MKSKAEKNTPTLSQLYTFTFGNRFDFFMNPNRREIVCMCGNWKLFETARFGFWLWLVWLVVNCAHACILTHNRILMTRKKSSVFSDLLHLGYILDRCCQHFVLLHLLQHAIKTKRRDRRKMCEIIDTKQMKRSERREKKILGKFYTERKMRTAE